jgi:hypothetical protein
VSIVKLREEISPEHFLVFKDQSEEEIFHVNQIRATLSCSETCRKYYLFRPHGKSINHEPKISREQSHVTKNQ